MNNNPLDESEWKTRRARIDPKLKSCGWSIVPFDSSKPLDDLNKCAITEFPTLNGPADYAFCSAGRIIGIVEAKKVSLGPQNVLTQAERYSRGFEGGPFDFNGLKVPFLYSTNGEVIWFHDIRDPLSRSRKVSSFHTPMALEELLSRDLATYEERLRALPNSHPLLRDYQKDANTAIEAAMAAHKREMLVAMATGTGKTFTTVNQVYRLMKSGVAKRILVLVDRRALAAQAVREFATFEAEPGLKFNQIYAVYSQRFRREDFDEDEHFDPNVLPASHLTEPKPGHAFVYVCTIQRMTLNLFGRAGMLATGDESADDEDSDQLDIPIHAFDVIVADECHRGYTASELSTWRNTLEHFDAVKIGLTATPASHTTSFFKEIVYRYPYDRAVAEGHLVDYDIVKVHSEVKMNGLFLQPGEQVDYVDPTTGLRKIDLLEDQRQFEATEIEEKVTSPESNKKILEEVQKYAIKHEEEFGRLPKILIFADNDQPHTSHADQLVGLARDIFGRGDSFVQKITGKVDRPLQWIRMFRNRPIPGIAITVDLLSTGVDIPDLEFIVFLRTVKSRILFEQMLGRGTRKGKLFPDKSHFVVFDCFDGTLFDYFRNATDIAAEPPQKEHRSIIEIIEDIWNKKDFDYNVKCLIRRLQRIDKEMSGEGREQFATFLENGDLRRFAESLPSRLHRDFTGIMQLLRNPSFQYLLLNYPRPPRTFLVALDSQDQVSSEWLVKGADGKDYKPADYLEAFSLFVKQNPNHIEAIQILLDRPEAWKTEALAELRKKLAAAPQRFNDRNLQKAHEVQYHKALVDIISMVKHAAREQEPLLTASERVSRAFTSISKGQSFTSEQLMWMERIKAHLVENLSIDEDDFANLPVFERAGGWRRANGAFDGKLADLISQLNAAIAA